MKKQSDFIYASKKIGNQNVTKKFTIISWKMLGSDKNGWKETPKELLGKSKDAVVPKNTHTVTEEYKGPKSTDDNLSIVNAVAHIKSLKTVLEIENYTIGDTKSTVVNAKNKFIKKIAKKKDS